MNSLGSFQLDLWTIWGLFAQFLFFLSFVVQWYKSEKNKQSHIPIEFWILRIIATLMLLVYVFQRRDIVFLISSLLQLVIYVRNIQLMKKHDQ